MLHIFSELKKIKLGPVQTFLLHHIFGGFLLSLVITQQILLHMKQTLELIKEN
jgi:hypothetical protein